MSEYPIADEIERAILREAPVWEESFSAGPGMVCSVRDAAQIASRFVGYDAGGCHDALVRIRAQRATGAPSGGPNETPTQVADEPASLEELNRLRQVEREYFAGRVPTLHDPRDYNCSRQRSSDDDV